MQFIGAIEAILISGKQLQKLYAEDDENNAAGMVKSALLRRLILTASSPPLISRAAQLLSSLNKEAANQGDILNLFNVSGGRFPEVGYCIDSKVVLIFCIMFFFLPHRLLAARWLFKWPKKSSIH